MIILKRLLQDNGAVIALCVRVMLCWHSQVML